jgi:hypothetical protein
VGIVFIFVSYPFKIKHCTEYHNVSPDIKQFCEAHYKEEAATQSLRPTHQTEDKVGGRIEITTMGKYAELTASMNNSVSWVRE